MGKLERPHCSPSLESWLVRGIIRMIPWLCIENFYRYIDHIIWLVVWNIFSHILEIIIPTDFHIFQRGWNHQPDIYVWTSIYLRDYQSIRLQFIIELTIIFKHHLFNYRCFTCFCINNLEYHPESASYCNLYILYSDLGRKMPVDSFRGYTQSRSLQGNLHF